MRRKLVATVVNLLLVFTLIFAHSNTAWALEDGEPEAAAEENVTEEESGQEDNDDVLAGEGENPVIENAGDVVVVVVGVSSQPEGYDEVEDPDIIDAEKYSLDVADYDQLLCWAASASDMLWMAGYAENCVNPQTGELFQSEDEVFDYFRNTFTDEGSLQEAGIEYFLNGTYKYQGESGASQVRDDGFAGGYFPEINASDVCFVIVNDPTMTKYDMIDEYYNLINEYGGAGSLGVNWWDIAEERNSDMGHALTLVDFEKDDNGYYVGVWFVDSDNDPVYSIYPTPTGEYTDDNALRAELAANQPNKMHHYNLSLQSVDNGLYYVIEGYGNSDYLAIIEVIIYLMEFNPDWLIPSGPSGKSEESTSVTNQAFANIKELMISTNAELLSFTDFTYDSTKDTGYSLFVRRPAGMLLNVYVDGNRLSEGGQEFKVYEAPSGIFALTIGTDTMRSLEAGEHMITLDFGKAGTVQTVVTVK